MRAESGGTGGFHAFISFDPKTKRVVKSIVVNHNDDTNTFQFSMLEKAADAKTYEFSPKRVPTYEVVELK